MTNLRAALLSLLVVGCTTDAPITDSGDPPTKGAPGLHGEIAEDRALLPLVADMCDESAYAGASWQSLTTRHFTLNYLPGTPAEHDKVEIATRLEEAYATIRGSLGIGVEPIFTVNLSPSRNAAVAHGRGFGTAWPEAGHYDVIYTGAGDSFEVRHYGQLLTKMLDYHVDSQHRMRVPLLATGVAEYFDQSGGDKHLAYARALAAGTESRVRFAELDALDITGDNPGRAGSLVQFLVDRYGVDTFMDLYRATAVRWTGSCYWNAVYGCLTTPDQLTSMLDGFLVGLVGDHWSEVQADWEQAIEAAMARMPLGMAPRPELDIGNVLRIMDHAINTKNAAEYRSTMEGFYCDAGGDASRDEIASRAVWAYGETQTQLLALYDTGIKSFWSAQAHVMRTDEYGVRTFGTVAFEHMPALGWRVTSSPDWY